MLCEEINMYFYNPNTKEILTKNDLGLKYNTSISNNATSYNEWIQLIIDKKPLVSDFQICVENPIELDGTVYKKTYTVHYKSLDVIRSLVHKKLNEQFKYASEKAYIKSSCGFTIDANEIANRDIDGLIKVMKAKNTTTELFRDYNNNHHEITLEQLEIMQLEVIENAQYLYKQKWNYSNEINSLTDVKTLIQLNFEFKYMDF